MATDICSSESVPALTTSAGAVGEPMHAFDLRVSERGGGLAIACFEIHPAQRAADSRVLVETPIVGFRDVRSSSGHQERRPVIRTVVEVGVEAFPIEVTLTSRDEMGFRMLLGRSAVRRRFLVDPGRSYRQGEPT